MGDPLAAVQPLGKQAADAVPKRIAGGQHDSRAATAGKHATRIERRRPGAASFVDVGEREVPFSAENRLGLDKRLSA